MGRHAIALRRNISPPLLVGVFASLAGGIECRGCVRVSVVSPRSMSTEATLPKTGASAQLSSTTGRQKPGASFDSRQAEEFNPLSESVRSQDFNPRHRYQLPTGGGE